MCYASNRKGRATVCIYHSWSRRPGLPQWMGGDGEGTIIYLKRWCQVFPGTRGKKAKQKRRASKNADALIAQFRKMAEQADMKTEQADMKVPDMKMPRTREPQGAIVVMAEQQVRQYSTLVKISGEAQSIEWGFWHWALRRAEMGKSTVEMFFKRRWQSSLWPELVTGESDWVVKS